MNEYDLLPTRELYVLCWRALRARQRSGLFDNLREEEYGAALYRRRPDWHIPEKLSRNDRENAATSLRLAGHYRRSAPISRSQRESRIELAHFFLRLSRISRKETGPLP